MRFSESFTIDFTTLISLIGHHLFLNIDFMISI